MLYFSCLFYTLFVQFFANVLFSSSQNSAGFIPLDGYNYCVDIDHCQRTGSDPCNTQDGYYCKESWLGGGGWKVGMEWLIIILRKVRSGYCSHC